jgi:hypothetical protein
MFERFTDDARVVIVHAQQHARRLGHRYVGSEHLLLAVVSTDKPVGAVLRERGITPDQVEEGIVRRVGLGAGAGLFAGLDADALAAIGVDLDAVRARIEGAFGPDALARAAQAVHRGPHLPRLNPRRAVPPGLIRAWRQVRRRRRPPVPISRAPQATGHYRAPGNLPAGRIPFTPRAKKCLQISVREADARHDQHIGVEHIALALLTVNAGVGPQILSALGASAAALRAAIDDRYRQAS